MLCRICKKPSHVIFNAQILKKYTIQYFFCKNCEFLQTEEPYWLDEAYQSAINITDTGVLTRNISLSKQAAVLLYFLFDRHGKFVDYAGGYGIFTRLMRDVGFDFYWYDIYAENLMARGFEYTSDLSQTSIELVTTFESFEHFVDPLQDIEKMLAILEVSGSKNILFTTELLPKKVPVPGDWWYYGLDHGQHIAFYSDKTLALIAQKYRVNYYSFGSLHLFTSKKINHVYYELLIKLSMNRLFPYVQKNMTGRAVQDMNFLKNRARLQ